MISSLLKFSSFYIYNFIIIPPFYIGSYFYYKWFQSSYYPLDKFYSENVLQQLNFIDEKHSDSCQLINSGFLLSNHRSFFDFFWDSYIFNSCMISRILAFVIVCFTSIISYLSDKTIIFNRGKTSRHSLFNECLSHLNNPSKKTKRILFYPEGSRKNHNYVTLNQHYLKPGLLKSIWEYSQTTQNDIPVQICISTNKENVINEKKLFVNKKKYGQLHCTGITDIQEPIKVSYYIDYPIYPKQYSSFEEFYNTIIKRWCYSWEKVYLNKCESVSCKMPLKHLKHLD